jgi:SpoIIAA-like
MIERITDMPPNVIGFRASGKVTGPEYHQFVDPVRDALARGDTVNYLFVTEPDFAGMDMAALWEDVKAAGSIGIRHRGHWGRFAVVTDKDWMRHAIAVFGWIYAGELLVFEPGELDEAKIWVAASAD